MNLAPVGVTLADAVCKCVADKPALENRPGNGKKRMLHHTVTEGRCRDEAFLGPCQMDLDILAGLIGSREKFALELQEFALERELEGRAAALPTLAADRPPGGCPERFETRDLREKIVVPSGHDGLSASRRSSGRSRRSGAPRAGSCLR